MSIKKHLLLVGLSVLFAGCSTDRYMNDIAGGKKETTAEIGTRYLLGRGVAQNYSKAFSYLKTAADEGDPFAENEIAYLYASGKGTEQDFAKSFFYYQQAANHGLASAQFNLGLMYLHGLGVPSNRELAMHWIQQSAAHGFEPAKIALSQNRF